MSPFFSVLTAVFDPVPAHLGACLASVDAQTGVSFEHVVVDDASTDPVVGATLTDGPAHRRVERRTANGGIVAASNDALTIAAGEWIVLLDHDDELATRALETLQNSIGEHPDVDVMYSDHDIIRPDGRLAEPAYKPDFSPERLRQTNYITHLVAIRRSALQAIGGFRAGTDGAQDHDVLLRLMEAGKRFAHVPEVLAHWRQSPRSVSTDPANKPAAFETGLDVVTAHLERSGIDAVVEAGPYTGTYRIRRNADRDALVSVIVPTAGSTGRVWGCERTFVVDAVRSLAERSSHRRLEFVVVADAATPQRALDALDRVTSSTGTSLNVVGFDEPFNFSRKINTGVAAASGDLLLLLNDDTELIDPDSVGVMAAHLMGPGAGPYGEVGAVGAKLLYADGTLQHGGHVYHHEFMHACIGWNGDHPGPQRMFAIERECSGVTAAACMTTRQVFDEVGGFPDDLPLHFNDVDFCLSVRETGRRILWTPSGSWYHFEGKSRERGATMREWTRVAARWPDGIPADPYANPNLRPKRSDWLELPGRSGAPPYVVDADGVKRWG
jgi:GT2 family glycosyltransferase